MSIIDRLRDFFNSPRQANNSARTSLRNKPGGLAFVKRLTDCPELNGCVVLTVAVSDGSKWAIEPKQRVVCREGLVTVEGRRTRAGDVGFVTAIHDDCLEPIPDTGVTNEEVRDLYLPKTPEVTA